MRNPGIGSAIVCLTLCLYMVSQAEADPSLVLCLDFESGQGDTVKDRSTYGNDGNIQGNAKRVDGKFGKGLKLDESSFVLVPDCDEFKITDEITLACWAKVESAGRYNFLITRWNWSAGSNMCYEMFLAAGAPAFAVSSDGAAKGIGMVTAKEPVELDKWHNIVTVFNGSKLIVYVDGEEVTSVDYGNKIFAGEGTICIGDNDNGAAPDYRFVGVIDEVAVYNRALSQDEIREKMTQGQAAAVESKGKLSTTWGGIKVQY